MLANRAAPLALLCLVAAAEGTAQTRSSRIRHEREWRVKAEKMDRHLLPTMRKHGIDMWVLMSRENHPDPILDLFGGFGVSGWYGHRNAYIFFDPSEGDVPAAVEFGRVAAAPVNTLRQQPHRCQEISVCF